MRAARARASRRLWPASGAAARAGPAAASTTPQAIHKRTRDMVYLLDSGPAVNGGPTPSSECRPAVYGGRRQLPLRQLALQRTDLLRHRPEADDEVPTGDLLVAVARPAAGADDEATVRREVDRADPVAVAAEGVQLAPGGGVPQPRRAVLAAGQQRPTVRRERHGQHRRLVAVELLPPPAGLQVEQVDRGAAGRRRDPPVRRQGQGLE